MHAVPQHKTKYHNTASQDAHKFCDKVWACRDTIISILLALLQMEVSETRFEIYRIVSNCGPGGQDQLLKGSHDLKYQDMI